MERCSFNPSSVCSIPRATPSPSSAHNPSRCRATLGEVRTCVDLSPLRRYDTEAAGTYAARTSITCLLMQPSVKISHHQSPQRQRGWGGGGLCCLLSEPPPLPISLRSLNLAALVLLPHHYTATKSRAQRGKKQKEGEISVRISRIQNSRTLMRDGAVIALPPDAPALRSGRSRRGFRHPDHHRRRQAASRDF